MEESKCHSYLQKGHTEGSRKLQASQIHLIPANVTDHIIMEAISKYTKDKKVTWSSQHGFVRDIMSDQPDEMASSLDNENKQWMLFALTLPRPITLFPVTSSDKILHYVG